MIGYHNISAWSQTQALVALSSGEAELYAMVKGACHTLGLMSLAADFGVVLHGKFRSDASAAIGIVNRTGVGRLRHVRVQYLWLQDKVRARELEVDKVPGEDNPADLLTKNVPEVLLRKHIKELGYEALSDRAVSAPKLNLVGGPGEDRRMDAERGLSQEDWWYKGEGKIVRHHDRPRKGLFDPIGVAEGPKLKSIEAFRVTKGVYSDGVAFEVVDTWRNRERKELDRLWVGTTTFVEHEF